MQTHANTTKIVGICLSTVKEIVFRSAGSDVLLSHVSRISSAEQDKEKGNPPEMSNMRNPIINLPLGQVSDHPSSMNIDESGMVSFD